MRNVANNISKTTSASWIRYFWSSASQKQTPNDINFHSGGDFMLALAPRLVINNKFSPSFVENLELKKVRSAFGQDFSKPE